VLRSEPADDKWVVIARIGRTRGLRGEVFVEPLTGDPERRLAELSRVYLRGARDLSPEHAEPVQVEKAWSHNGRCILKFRELNSIEEAERWRGALVCIPVEERPALEEGEYYLSDLVGCDVLVNTTGEFVGKVTSYYETGGPVLLAVSRTPEDKDEILLPLAKSICTSIDLEGRRIRIEPPEGLLDLNRGSS
jgi:16S rRNA processing protein RimM